MNNTLTALSGVEVGHATHLDLLTGCTVIRFDRSLPAVCRSYGGAPGLFNSESLQTGKTPYGLNGIFVAGGSMTGLASASEIMNCMIQDGVGAKIGKMTNPSIAGAIIFDQGTQVGQYDPKFGAEAYRNLSKKAVSGGSVGAGTGASVGKLRAIVKDEVTMTAAMKAGLGSARIDLGAGVTVCAMTVVNALGNVVLPDGKVLAGNRDQETRFRGFDDLSDFVTRENTNTTISIVGINVDMGATEHYEKIAHMATHGQVRSIFRINTSADGDTVFVFSTQEIKDPLNHMGKYFGEVKDGNYFAADIIGQAAADAVQESIYDACRQAETIVLTTAYEGIMPSCNDY